MTQVLRRLLAAELLLLVVLAAVWAFSRDDRQQQRLTRLTASFLDAVGKADDPRAFQPPNLSHRAADRLLDQIAETALHYGNKNNIQAIRDGSTPTQRAAGGKKPDKRLLGLIKLLQGFDLKGLAQLNRQTPEGRAKARGMLYRFLGELYRLRFDGMRLLEARVTEVKVVRAGPLLRATVSFSTPTGNGSVVWVKQRKGSRHLRTWQLDVAPERPQHASRP